MPIEFQIDGKDRYFFVGVLEQKLKLSTFPFPASLLGEIWKSDIIWWSKLGRAFAAKLGKSHTLPRSCWEHTYPKGLRSAHDRGLPWFAAPTHSTSQSTQHPLPSHPTSFPWGLACWSPCLQMWVGGGESSRPWGELFLSSLMRLTQKMMAGYQPPTPHSSASNSIWSRHDQIGYKSLKMMERLVSFGIELWSTLGCTWVCIYQVHPTFDHWFARSEKKREDEKGEVCISNNLNI